jgi:AcrR family transcriptional regulator
MAADGLRERKKQATRQALSWAALRLAVERGVENVRVEEIAAEAGVSPRTFNNYFASKYEALAARQLDRSRKSAELLRSRPADEPLWDAIVHAMLRPLEDEGADDPTPEWLAAIRRLLSEPAMLAEIGKIGMAHGNELAAAVAERTGTDPQRDLYPRLVAAAVEAAAHVATDQWLHADPPVPLLPLLREALRQLASGLPDPST